MSPILGHPFYLSPAVPHFLLQRLLSLAILYLSPAVPHFLLQRLLSWAILSISSQLYPTSSSNVSYPWPSSISPQLYPTSSSNVSDPGPSSLSLTRCALLPRLMSPILGHPFYLSPAVPHFLLQCLRSWAILSISPQLYPTSSSNVSDP